MNKNIAIVIAQIALIIITIVLTRSCHKPIDQPVLDNNALKFSKDSLQSVNNAIVMDMATFKKVAVDEKDSLTRLLQAAVTKNTISISAISTKVSSEVSGKTSVTPGSTEIHGDTVRVFPIYSYDKADTCEEVHVMATKDSTHVSFTLFNRQLIESKFQSSGFLGLGKKSIVLEVTNSNPKIRTLDQKSFVTPMPKANRLLWFVGGMIIGTGTYIYAKR